MIGSRSQSARSESAVTGSRSGTTSRCRSPRTTGPRSTPAVQLVALQPSRRTPLRVPEIVPSAPELGFPLPRPVPGNSRRARPGSGTIRPSCMSAKSFPRPLNSVGGILTRTSQDPLNIVALIKREGLLSAAGSRQVFRECSEPPNLDRRGARVKLDT